MALVVLPTVAPASGILGVLPETGGFSSLAGFRVESRVEMKHDYFFESRATVRHGDT